MMKETGAHEPRSWAVPCLIAVVAILIRLPFLLKGQGFFNSDEAVEGLMARHVDQLPIFLWGQSYKGVPEVYLFQVVFSVFGAGVIPLKSVTLLVWAFAVGATTRLGQLWYGNAIAIVAGILLASSSPMVASWALTASAEASWLIALVALMLIAYENANPRTRNAVIPLLCGVIVWIHPAGIWAVIALSVVAILRSEWWHTNGLRGIGHVLLGDDLPSGIRAVVLVFHCLIAAGMAVFLFTFLGGRA